VQVQLQVQVDVQLQLQVQERTATAVTATAVTARATPATTATATGGDWGWEWGGGIGGPPPSPRPAASPPSSPPIGHTEQKQQQHNDNQQQQQQRGGWKMVVFGSVYLAINQAFFAPPLYIPTHHTTQQPASDARVLIYSGMVTNSGQRSLIEAPAVMHEGLQKGWKCDQNPASPAINAALPALGSWRGSTFQRWLPRMKKQRLALTGRLVLRFSYLLRSQPPPIGGRVFF